MIKEIRRGDSRPGTPLLDTCDSVHGQKVTGHKVTKSVGQNVTGRKVTMMTFD